MKMNKAILLIGLILLMGIVVGCVEPKQVYKLNIDDCQIIEMVEKTWDKTTEHFYCSDGKCCATYSSWGDCYKAICYLQDLQKG